MRTKTPARRRPPVVTTVPPETPIPEQAAGHLKKLAMLEAYADEGTVTHACQRAGVGRTTHYVWLESDPDYARLFGEARESVADSLEQEAIRRARKGWLEPVFYQGRACGAVKKFSDTLLIFMLKALRPEKYRERYEHTGAGGGPIQLQAVPLDVLALLTDEELRALDKVHQLDQAARAKALPPTIDASATHDASEDHAT